MTQEEKFTYGKLIAQLYKQYKEEVCLEKELELLRELNKLKLINPEYFDFTIRLIGH
jgi:hypothetical protein